MQRSRFNYSFGGNMKRNTSWIYVASAAAGIILSGAAPASAAPAPATGATMSRIVAPTAVAPARGSVTYWRYEVVDLKKTKNWTNTSKVLGSCKVSKGVGGYCKINRGFSTSTEISVSLGAPIRDVSAGIGFNWYYGTTGFVEWSSDKISKKKTATYTAYATGTKATYKIQKWKGTKALGQKKTVWKLVETSKTLQAFSPTPGGGFDIKGSIK